MFDWLRGQTGPAFADPLEPSAVPAPLPSDDGETGPQARALALLASILHDETEIAGPFPVGGPAGTYYLRSPFGTDSEYTIITVSFTAAATAILQQTAGPQTYGATSTYNPDPMPTFRGIPVASPGANSIPGYDIWFPLPANENLYINVTGSGSVVFVIAFRRRLNPSGTVVQ